MRRLSVPVALIAGVLLAAAVASAGPPRLEQKRLRAADVALARHITLRASDLARGWSPGRVTPLPERLPACPGVDLDFSAYTITGRAQSKFVQDVAGIESVVEVFESRRDAVGDFRKGANPRLLRCVAAQLGKQGITVVSTRVVDVPRVGERSVAFRVVLAARGTRVYMDVLGVQRGRSIVGLYFTDTRPIAGRVAVARSIAARMR